MRIGPAWGYVDKDGKLGINPQFEEGGDFSDGLALVRVNGRYGYIDKSGKLTIQPQFDSAGGFSDGLALVEWQANTDTSIRAGKCRSIRNSNRLESFRTASP